MAGRAGGRPRRRWPRIVGGLLLALVGGVFALGTYGGAAPLCENSATSSQPLESAGNAVAVTSSVLEFASGTSGLLCDSARTLRVRASARPAGEKPVFLGVGKVVPTRRYLGSGRYELAASWLEWDSLRDVRRAGSPPRRLAPPARTSVWLASAVAPSNSGAGLARLTHRWRAVGEPFSGGTPRADRFWLVVMNADGSPGVAAALEYEVGSAPRATWPWLVGVAAGIGLAVTGIAVAARRPRRSRTAT